jgi:hypothetical protein
VRISNPKYKFVFEIHTDIVLTPPLLNTYGLHILPDKLRNTVIYSLHSGQYPKVNKHYCVKCVYQTPLTSVASCINNKGGVRGTPPCALGSDWTAGPFVSLISTTAVSWQHPGIQIFSRHALCLETNFKLQVRTNWRLISPLSLVLAKREHSLVWNWAFRPKL